MLSQTTRKIERAASPALESISIWFDTEQIINQTKQTPIIKPHVRLPFLKTWNSQGASQLCLLGWRGGLQSPPPTRNLSLPHCGSPPSIWKRSEVRRKLERSNVQRSFSQPRELCQGPGSRPKQCPAWLVVWIEKLIYSRTVE